MLFNSPHYYSIFYYREKEYEECLILLRSSFPLLKFSYQALCCYRKMAAQNLFSNMTISDIEALLDGCLSVMDIAMNRKMELEGRSKKRRLSLTALNPEEFTHIMSTVFTELYDMDLEAHKSLVLKKARLVKDEEEQVESDQGVSG